MRSLSDTAESLAKTAAERLCNGSAGLTVLFGKNFRHAGFDRLAGAVSGLRDLFL